MSKTGKKDGKQGGDRKVKITESELKKIIKNKLEEYLKEISTLGSGAVEGFPGGFKGGEEEDDPESPTHSKTKRGTKNVK